MIPKERKRKVIIILIFFFGFFIPSMFYAQVSPLPYVPIDKKLDPQWVSSLYEKGERKIYKGKELKHIAMPCGGIGTGQVDITGEGKINFTESIFNTMQQPNAGHGFSTGFQYLNPISLQSKVDNSFSIIIKQEKLTPEVLKLNSDDFNDIQFIGEYPIAHFNYRRTEKKLPVEIKSEVFSPFIPLNVRNSSNPVTVLKYSVTNTSKVNIDVLIAGWLKNIDFPEKSKIKQVNRAVKSKDISGISFEMQPIVSSEDVLRHSQLGGFSLSVLDKKGKVSLQSFSPEQYIKKLVVGDTIKNQKKSYTSNSAVGGSVSSSIKLKPNETKSITFLITWYFPNLYENATWDGKPNSESPGWVGHIYNNWYKKPFDVAEYISSNFSKLYKETKLYHDTYFDTTIPYWLANRITMPVSTLASGNVSIWKNGRMYVYEGIGFCQGTCGHVFNFVTAISKLFPELERSVRLQQDLNDTVAYSTSGRINFRGYNGNNPKDGHSYASDAQSGYVLKTYREHLMSDNNNFLDTVWDKVKMVIGYNIFKDGAEIGKEPNGVLEGKQTFWDPMWYGPNPYNNTLYLAALRAAEEMAKIKGENELAKRYHSIFEKGQNYMNENMWNGEFYIHLYPMGFKGNVGSWGGFREPKEIDNQAKGYIENFNKLKPNYYSGGSCDANQLFGQNWAHQLGLGYILPKKNCAIAAKNIYKYCWTPNIATVYNSWKPEHRTLADSGESGMVNAAWPKKERLEFENYHDKNDVWTGLEYEAAVDMINEGHFKEALVSLRAIDERYNGLKRNPWNEIEGSDHYVRAMHSWSVLLSLSGFTYDGPAGKIGFSPAFSPTYFKSFFSTASGWGNISQKIRKNKQQETIEIKWGQLHLSQLKFSINDSIKYQKTKIMLNGNILSAKNTVTDKLLITSLKSPLILKKGDILSVEIN